MDLSRVVIGHSGDTTDLDYLEELIAAGSYLGMDRFGIDLVLPFEDRVDTVAAMCERGHADKMVLSHDANCYFDALPGELSAAAAPNWHYLHIHHDVLRRCGSAGSPRISYAPCWSTTRAGSSSTPAVTETSPPPRGTAGAQFHRAEHGA